METSDPPNWGHLIFHFFHFENNSLELVLSKLTSVLEWNAASLTITSPLFRSTFSIIHERIILTLVCRLLIRRFVIDCLALTRNKSGSIQSFPSFRYCVDILIFRYFDTVSISIFIDTVYCSFWTLLNLSIGSNCLSCCTSFQLDF